jgi:hypothetical protein
LHPTWLLLKNEPRRKAHGLEDYRKGYYFCLYGGLVEYHDNHQRVAERTTSRCEQVAGAVAALMKRVAENRDLFEQSWRAFDLWRL